MKKIFFVLWLCLLFSGCSKGAGELPLQNTDKDVNDLNNDLNKETTVEQTTEETTETTTIDEIASQIAEMSLDEKIGQMFIIDYGDLDDSFVFRCAGDEYGDFDVKEDNVGGFILFDEDIKGVADTVALTEKLKEISKIPPFIAIDEEGGQVSRIESSGAVADYDIPSARYMANNDSVEENYTKIAKTLSAMGFNLDFAPDADVDTNPNNPIIGNRAFSSDAETAGNMAVIAMNALRSNGVIPVIKHFPGHGDTATDSHLGTAVLPHGRERIDNIELVPFKKAIENDAPMIMVGHIKTPAISDKDLPASLNPDIVTGLLREELGYDGVVITDAMNMGAVSGRSDGIIDAVNAGVDIILMPTDLKSAFYEIESEVQNGNINEKRIDESVCRILKLKRDMGIKY